ncbi:MAG: alpha-amylase family glycosyl hydrolase [Chloroflexota bacterium]
MDDFIFGTLATDALKHERVYGFRRGIYHNFQREPLDPSPAEPVRVRLSVGPDQDIRYGWIYWTNDGSDPQGKSGNARQGYAAPLRLAYTEWDTVLWGYRSHYEAVIPGMPAGSLVRYRFGVDMPGKGEVSSDEGSLFGYYVDDDPPPAWARDAVVYEIFVDRFYPGHDQGWLKSPSPGGFYGGRLRGITEKMGYLAELGINTLWLTPVFPSPSHHGYDATNLMDIEPRLGSQQDLRELLTEAHLAGIRVLLDLVPNHISNQHPFFQDAFHNPDSRYRSWFNFSSYPDEYETFFGVKSLPQLNLRNSKARQYVLDAAKFWLDFGVDGYRVDYAIGPAPDFWAEFRQVTRRAKPDCWTFGEIVDPSDVQLTFAGQLDGALDFILLEGVRQSLAFGRWNAQKLSTFIDRHELYFPADFSLPSFLDNHDMNRFLWAAGNDKRRLRLAAMLQFSLAGAPVIYYGTEVGLSQQRDVRQGTRGVPEESRLPMLWGDDQDLDLRGYYQALIRLRNQSAVLRRGKRNLIEVDENRLVFRRIHEHEMVITALNLGNQQELIRIPGRWQPAVVSCQDVKVVCDERNVDISLPPLGGVILT